MFRSVQCCIWYPASTLTRQHIANLLLLKLPFRPQWQHPSVRCSIAIIVHVNGEVVQADTKVLGEVETDYPLTTRHVWRTSNKGEAWHSSDGCWLRVKRGVWLRTNVLAGTHGICAVVPWLSRVFGVRYCLGMSMRPCIILRRMHKW